jgi:hypothetical protein
MPNHTNQKLSLGASIPVASNRFQSVIRHFPELGILAKIVQVRFALDAFVCYTNLAQKSLERVDRLVMTQGPTAIVYEHVISNV